MQVERLTLEATYVGDPSLPASSPLARSQSSSGGGGAGRAGASTWKPSAVALWMPPGTKPTKVQLRRVHVFPCGSVVFTVWVRFVTFPRR